MKYRIILTVVLGLLIIAACSVSDSGSDPPQSTATISNDEEAGGNQIILETAAGLLSPITETPVVTRPSETAATSDPQGTIQTTSSPTITVPAVMELCSPLAGHVLEELPEIVSDPYNPPPPGKEERHHGVDFSYYRRGERLSIEGVQVQTVLPGSVVAAISEAYPYGNMVIIETTYRDLPEAIAERTGIKESQSLYILYAHLGEPPEVMLGDSVGSCQAIGVVGKSGGFLIPHLHLETRIGPEGATFPHMGYYRGDMTDEERQNYLIWRTSGAFQHFDPMTLLLR